MTEQTPHFDRTKPRTVQRWWPTIEMLEAGTELFLAEWKPVGIRPADVPRDTLEDFVFHFFGPLLAPRRNVDPITHTLQMIGSAEADRVGLPRSPEAHRRHLAEALSDIVRRAPLPEPLIEMPPSTVVMTSGDFLAGPPALDPEGVCVQCHAFGTVARVTVQSKPPRTSRFCAACWKEVRSEYMSHEAPRPPSTARERIAFMDGSPRPAMSAESRSWDDVIDFIRLIMAAREDPEQQQAIAPLALAEMAAEIRMEADKMDGEMPAEVDAFVRTFSVST
jgi:hypothetical protein